MGRRKKSFYKKVAQAGPTANTNPKTNSEKISICQSKETDGKIEKKDLYPNCDTSIWLRSCQQEVINPVHGVPTGQVPTWLQGSLLRNGPGSLKVGEMEFDHLFDSSALLHRFSIENGKVTYQNRFLQSETFKKNHAAQRIVISEFGTSAVPDPCHTIFDRVSAVFNSSDQSDNAMISIYPFGDQMFALTETPVMLEVNPTSLETGARIDMGEKMGILNHTSHPHVMPDGTVFNLGMAIYSTGPRYCILKFPPKTGECRSVFDNAEIVASVPCRWRFHPSYMHTFGITDNFFIIVEQPLSVSVGAVVKNKLMNRPIASALRWYQHAETKIYLISRTSGKVEYTFSADSLFYLHIINQYEDDNHVILDICCYKDPSILDCMYISALKEAQHNPDYATMFRGRPLRFVLPLIDRETLQDLRNQNITNLNNYPNSRSEANLLGNGTIFVKPHLLCTLGCETPRINYESFCGKKYRYFYAISSDVDALNPGTLIKVDTKTLTKKTWGEKNMYPSEPVFVPKPGGIKEDEGVILSAVVWGGEQVNQTGLLILDAQSWTELSRTVFTVDGPVPKCLHGWFVSNQ